MFRHDRECGDRIRTAVAGHRGARLLARPLAAAMSPFFQIAVAAAIVDRGRRVTGVRMLIAGGAAAIAARVLRDRIGRERPGEREEGAFPSRHAAAATAISATALSRQPLLGLPLAAAAAVGSVARIATAEHDPADIAAGALLGIVVAHVIAFPLSPLRLFARALGVR